MTVSEHIYGDLRTRIRAGGVALANPTLKSLATHYDVSIMPVRRAVAMLIDQRFLLKQPNGRFSVNPEAVQRPLPGAAPEPRKDWQRIITDEVVRLSFRGEAAFLREEATAGRHGVSRTIVRQVFHRLAGAGVIEHLPRRGWRIRPTHYQDIEAFIDIRETLELKALELACPHLVPSELEEILAATTGPQPATSLPVDDRLHKYLIEKSGNRYIQEFFDRYRGRYFYRILFDFEHDKSEVAAAVAQHREVLEALLAKDWPRARAALSHHLRYQLPVLAKKIDQLVRRGSSQESGRPEPMPP